MSLQKLQKLNDEVVNVIILVQSASLAYLIRNEMKDQYKAHKDFIVDVTTQKQLNDAKLDSYVAPMMCDKWLIHVDADKVSQKDVIAGLNRNTHYGVTVYWTEKWSTFNKLINLDIVKRQGVHTPYFRFTRLSFYEIKNLLETEVPPKKQLSEELKIFVCKNYRFDVQSVMDLVSLLKSGNPIETKKELIEAIGVGGNSVANLTIKILKAKPKTEKGRKKIISDTIKLMRDLSYSYDYRSIRNFMINNIEGCVEMKTLQIMGLYNKPNKEIPEAFDSKRLGMLRRFEYIILDEVSFPRLLNLKFCLLKYSNFHAEASLIQAIMDYFNHFEVEPDKPRKAKKKKE